MTTQAPHPIALTAAGKRLADARVEAAMDAFYPGEDWRVALGIALPDSLRDMRAAIAAADAAAEILMPAEGAGLREALAVIEFAQTIDDHYDMREFLKSWSEGDVSEWPEFAEHLAAALTNPRSAPLGNASLREAAQNAEMYLRTGFINCERCGHEQPTANTDAENELRAALVSPQPAVEGPVAAGDTIENACGPWTYEDATLTPPADPKPTVPGNDAGMREADIASLIRTHVRLEWHGHDHADINPRSVTAAAQAIAAALTPQTGSAGEDPKTPDAGVDLREALARHFHGIAFSPGLIGFGGIWEMHREEAYRRADAALDHPAPVGEDETGVQAEDETRRANYAEGRRQYWQREAERLAWMVRNLGGDPEAANQPPKAETPAGVGDAIRILTAANRTGDLPSCMMPDGAEPCSAFSGLDQGIRDALAALSAVPAARPGDGVDGWLPVEQFPPRTKALFGRWEMYGTAGQPDEQWGWQEATGTYYDYDGERFWNLDGRNFSSSPFYGKAPTHAWALPAEPAECPALAAAPAADGGRA